jgi:hypothetical protein
MSTAESHDPRPVHVIARINLEKRQRAQKRRLLTELPNRKNGCARERLVCCEPLQVVLESALNERAFFGRQLQVLDWDVHELGEEQHDELGEEQHDELGEEQHAELFEDGDGEAAFPVLGDFEREEVAGVGGGQFMPARCGFWSQMVVMLASVARWWIVLRERKAMGLPRNVQLPPKLLRM